MAWLASVPRGPCAAKENNVRNSSDTNGQPGQCSVIFDALWNSIKTHLASQNWSTKKRRKDHQGQHSDDHRNCCCLIRLKLLGIACWSCWAFLFALISFMAYNREFCKIKCLGA
mmetsp:Transcript_26082/g.39959  ORF Transcript_26082/g.39959 Transcript_26082/m.39959 type:complete len:114 (-) Transcript_26082:323-664(-)